MQTTTSMTADEIRQKFLEIIAEFEQKLRVVEVGVIEDYPIGGQNRGKCALRVETKKNEWRTVKTTTNKYGRWCNPKKSTYRTGYGFVVAGELVERDYEWLSISLGGIRFHAANGDDRVFFASPFSNTTVRTEDSTWTFGDTTTTYKADAPEVIEAWYAYLECLSRVGKRLEEMRQLVEVGKQEVEKSHAS